MLASSRLWMFGLLALSLAGCVLPATPRRIEPPTPPAPAARNPLLPIPTGATERRAEPPAPHLSVEGVPRGWRRGGERVVLSYEVTGEGSVDLEFSVDGGEWRAVGTGLGARERIVWRLPRVPRGVVRLRCTLMGPRQDVRARWDFDPFRIDSVAPEVSWRPVTGGSELRYEASDPEGSGISEVALYQRVSDDEAWERVHGAEITESTIRWPQPVDSDPEASSELWVVVWDAAGNPSAAPPRNPPRATVVFDPEAPVPGVRLLSFQDGGSYEAGSRQDVRWEWRGSPWSAGEVVVEFSRDAGATWEAVGSVSLGEWNLPWRLPPEPADAVVLRVSSREFHGRRTQDRSAVPFRIHPSPPPTPRPLAPATLTHPRSGVLAGGTRHYVFWESPPEDDGPWGGTVALEYQWVDEDPAVWVPVATSLPRSGRHPWTAPEREGALRLRLSTTGPGGAVTSGEPSDPIRIVLPRQEARFLGPRSSNRRRTVLHVGLADSDGIDWVQVWLRPVSTPHWRRVAEARPGEPLVAEVEDGLYRVSVRTGSAAARTDHPPDDPAPGDGRLLVDTVPPRLDVQPLGSRPLLGGSTVTILANALDDHASPFPLRFRFSTDGGESFRLARSRHPNGTAFDWTVPETEGLVILEVAATDLAGNWTQQLLPVHVQRPPVTVGWRVRIAGAEPDRDEPASETAPELAGALLASGTRLQVEWWAEGVDATGARARFELATDGESWVPVHVDLSPSGRLEWRVPPVDAARCRLRLLVEAADGRQGVARSGEFAVSHTAPAARATAIRARGDSPDRP